MSLNNHGLIEFLLDMSVRQITERQLFSKELLDSIREHLGMEKAVIICFDTRNNFLSWTDENGVRTGKEDHPYRKFLVNDVVEHFVYDTSLAEKLNYFNVEPKLYKSVDVINPVDYENSAFVRFLEENFHAHYSVTLAFGINSYIQVVFYKTKEEGDFTEEEMQELRNLYVYIANTYRNFKMHEQTKIVSELKDKVIGSGDSAYFIADAFGHVLAHNKAAAEYIREILGDSVPEKISPKEECSWLPFFIKEYGKEHAKESSFDIKNYLFRTHIYEQSYEHGIIDQYYLVTISEKTGSDKKKKGNVKLSCLTSSERKVAEQLAKGKTYRDIADDLSVSYHTVKNHVQNIYSKCGINNRYQLQTMIND